MSLEVVARRRLILREIAESLAGAVASAALPQWHPHHHLVKDAERDRVWSLLWRLSAGGATRERAQAAIKSAKPTRAQLAAIMAFANLVIANHNRGIGRRRVTNSKLLQLQSDTTYQNDEQRAEEAGIQIRGYQRRKIRLTKL